MLHRPNARMIVLVVGSTVVVIGLPILGWGDWDSFFAHPARVALCAITLALTVLALFAGISLGAGKRQDRRDRRIFVPMVVLSLLLVWLPAYGDRRNLWTIDGDTTRYVGLALFLVGGLLRVGATFVLGRRFSPFVAIQEDHKLQTTGLYRMIRHPSYLGALLALFGYVLVFRSSIGLLIALLFFPLLIVRMDAEEAMLLSEFGAEYAAYRKRTWRLIPLLY